MIQQAASGSELALCRGRRWQRRAREFATLYRCFAIDGRLLQEALARWQCLGAKNITLDSVWRRQQGLSLIVG
jgi:hypothetical protein